MNRIAAALLALGATGCTTVEIQGETTITRRYLGLLVIARDPAATTVAVRSRTIGASVDRSSLVLGFSESLSVTARLPEQCSLVAFISPTEVRSRIQSQAPGSVEGDPCSVNSKADHDTPQSLHP